MELIFSAGALDEMEDSAAYYEGEVEGLGQAFLSAVAHGVAKISAA